jgi:hypothetical protein
VSLTVNEESESKISILYTLAAIQPRSLILCVAASAHEIRTSNKLSLRAYVGSGLSADAMLLWPTT